MNNFLKTSDFSRAELEEIIESALKYKSGEISDKPLSGKLVAPVFLIQVCGHALRCSKIGAHHQRNKTKRATF